MKVPGFLAFCFVCAATTALSQPSTPGGVPGDKSLPVETITVQGQKVQERVIRTFVENRTAPTYRAGKIARWETPICPVATGLKPEFIAFLEQRLRDIAGRVGARVDANAGCTANIEIVFTTQPQSLLDNIRRNQPVYLGYYSDSAQADELAKVTRPIQAWYTTSTIDIHGLSIVDCAKCGSPCKRPPLCYPGALNVDVNGLRYNDGLRSAFYHVIIVANPDKLVDHEVGSLADYIALLALAQPRSVEDCQTLPSVLNLLAPACASASGALQISDSDLGYLRGLYHMSAGRSLRDEQDDIAYQVSQALGGH